MATDSRGFLRQATEVSAFNLGSPVKSMDAFLRNLRNLWFFLAEAEQLQPTNLTMARIQEA